MKKLRPAWRNYLLELTAFVLFGIIYLAVPEDDGAKGFLGAVALLFLLVPVYQRFSNKYEFDAKKVEAHKGIIARKLNTIRLKDLRSVNLKQGIIQRFLNTGNLEFSSAGGGGVEVTYKGIVSPKKVKDEIEDLRETVLEN